MAAAAVAAAAVADSESSHTTRVHSSLELVGLMTKPDIMGSTFIPMMMASIYLPPCRRKDMKKSTFLLSIILLSSSISGCTGEVDEATGEDENGDAIIMMAKVTYLSLIHI